MLCSKCKLNPRQIAKAGHELSWCKECISLQSKSWYNRFKARSFAKSTQWRLKHPEEYRAMLRKSMLKRRILALEYYSNGKLECACCKDNHIEFLVIDHINGGGLKHRQQLGQGGQYIYSWLKKNNFPDGFRVLCYNCNSALGHYHYCPHQKYPHEKDTSVPNG